MHSTENESKDCNRLFGLTPLFFFARNQVAAPRGTGGLKSVAFVVWQKSPKQQESARLPARPRLPDATLKAYSTIGFIKPLNAQPTMPPMMPSGAPHCAKAMPARADIAVHIPHAFTNTPRPQPHPVTANRPPAGRRRPGFSARGRKGRSSCPCMPCRASWHIRRGRTRRSPATG